MNECTVTELRNNFGDDAALLIDVREFPEYAAGRISGAKHIPLGEIESRKNEIAPHKRVYVLCRTGKRSAAAQKKLYSLGFSNVINVAGGFESWKKEGFHYERDENAPWSLERQVRLVAGLLVLSGVLLGAFVHPNFLWLAGFVGAGLTFAGASDWCGMALLLAKMPWNQKKEHSDKYQNV